MNIYIFVYILRRFEKRPSLFYSTLEQCKEKINGINDHYYKSHALNFECRKYCILNHITKLFISGICITI